MGDTEQNDAIKSHMRRSAIHSQDPDEDSWSSRSIYDSAGSTAAPTVTTRTPTVVTRPAPAGSRGRPAGTSGAASTRSTRATEAAQATDAPGGSIGAEEVSNATARAEATAGAVEEDMEEEVTNAAPSATTLTPERSELVMSLLSAIQSQDPQAAIHLQALMNGASPPIPAVQVHPAAGALTRWAQAHGYVKPTTYKESCET
jgi:hypothetical protein